MARPGHGHGDELVLPLTGTVIMRGDNVAAVSPVRTRVRARACARECRWFVPEWCACAERIGIESEEEIQKR
jgi:hypothetical protein